MTTLFLPGMSLRNKDWMEQTISDLPQIKFTPIYWNHWQTSVSESESFPWETELTKVKQSWIEPVNILAKSIGTLAAIKLLNQGLKAQKIIFCGLPFETLPEVVDEFSKCLTHQNFSQLLCIQNQNDPCGKYDVLEKLVNRLGKTSDLSHVKVEATNREDHHYPFTDQFQAFLI